MKRNNLFFCVLALVSCNFIRSSSQKVYEIHTPDGAIQFVINTSNHQKNTTINHASTISSQTIEHSNTVPSESWYAYDTSWFGISNPGEFILGASCIIALGTYAYIYYQLRAGNTYLANKSLWSSWYKKVELQELLTINQKELTKDLLNEIHQRYPASKSISTMLNPLLTFLQAIEEEQRLLEWYDTLYSYAGTIKGYRIFPLSLEAYQTIPERLQRLAYYKNLFNSWASEYTIYETDSSGQSQHKDRDIITAMGRYITEAPVKAFLQGRIKRVDPNS